MATVLLAVRWNGAGYLHLVDAYQQWKPTDD